jgi:glutaminyl-tRNA synthetase
MKSSDDVNNTETEESAQLDFIRARVADDLARGKNDGRVHTRFPPEPNGYLHIGHAKSICLNFGIADEYGGLCNLRFDDSNPETEDVEYVESIKEDVRWLGFDWQDRLYHASDYFDRLYRFAEELITKGLAYVDDQSEEEIRKHRGTVKLAGTPSPNRNRSVEENLDLFRRMRAGEFADGARVLRAGIDMAAANMKMRDPLIYRIRHQRHYRTGDAWCIYPMYDFTHCLSDALEGITHSVCTLEFENNRELYDWFIEHLDVPHVPKQIEFARLNLSRTLLSKRKLLKLVEDGVVDGWDDPRMPTICGLRRRGYTPQAIRAFCDRIGVAKRDSEVDVALLEFHIREDLNQRAPRYMAVLDPLKVVITDYPEGKVEEVEAENNPEEKTAGTRMVPFSREVWIEREDFLEDPPKKFFRLAPGREVRLKHAYYITCDDVVKDDRGAILELHCSHDPSSRGGGTEDNRRVKGTLHWVSAAHALDAEVRLFDHLLAEAGDGAEPELNPDSLKVLQGCKLEPALARMEAGTACQFMRQGYFCVDSRDSAAETPVFNRTVTLRDSWAKIEKKAKAGR